MARIVIRLDEVLHARRMTQTELATRIGITLANLSILKTGKAKAIRLSTLEAICAALVAEGFYPVDPVLAARILRLVIEGTWLDMMTQQSPYSPTEARRTVMASARLCFPRHFPAP